MKPQVEKVGARIHLTSEFTDKDRAKSVIGARWAAKARIWTYPLDLETCRNLRDAFGDRLQIGPELWAWAEGQRRRETALTSLVSGMDLTEVVDLPNVRTQAPTMWAAMQQRPYQPVASKYMSMARRCLNGDQPGIGKTIETLGALVEAGVTGPVLVLAPKTSALTVWPAEIARWFADDVPHTVNNIAGLTAAKRESEWDTFVQLMALDRTQQVMNILIANAEQVGIAKFTECPDGICDGDEDWCPSLDKHINKSQKRRPFLHSVAWHAVIADETHKWLINTRGKAASQVGYGFTRLPVTEDALMYALSGTPLKGKKWNIFGTVNWLFPKTHTSKWRFIESFWHVDKVENEYAADGIERTITGAWASPKAKEAFFRTLSTVMIRRTKAELRAINPAWMPPEKRYHDVYVPMEKTQATHYRAMEKAQAVVIKDQRLTATGILAEMTRLRQFANSDGEIVAGNFKPTLPSGKFTWLLGFLEERGIEQGTRGAPGDLSEDVRKVVVASQFTTLIDQWESELIGRGINVVSITGHTSDKRRSENMVRFQQDPGVRVCLINTMAGGVSITLDAADDIVLMDETWVPDDSEQVEDRVHRASNVTHQVDVWYVRSSGTIEEQIASANVDKAESNHVVLDAQRGLAFARKRYNIKEEK